MVVTPKSLFKSVFFFGSSSGCDYGCDIMWYLGGCILYLFSSMCIAHSICLCVVMIG